LITKLDLHGICSLTAFPRQRYPFRPNRESLGSLWERLSSTLRHMGNRAFVPRFNETLRRRCGGILVILSRAGVLMFYILTREKHRLLSSSTLNIILLRPRFVTCVMWHCGACRRVECRVQRAFVKQGNKDESSGSGDLACRVVIQERQHGR